jgi:hypothetical protein
MGRGVPKVVGVVATATSLQPSGQVSEYSGWR